MVEAETVPAWVVSFEEAGDASRPPLEKVIQITQAMLENQSIEDAATHAVPIANPCNVGENRPVAGSRRLPM
jgi:hypothetical protein